MADNVAITAGSGTSIAADDISSVFYQRVKIAAGADGAAADVPGDGAAGLATGGSVAHDAADSGNPVKIGGKARSANPTAVADGDRSHLYTDLAGRLITREGQPRDLIGQSVIATTSSTSEETLLAAGGSGVYHDLTTLVLTNSDSSTRQVWEIRDTTGGTIRMYGAAAPGSSFILHFERPWKQTTANANWTIQAQQGIDWSAAVQAEKNTA